MRSCRGAGAILAGLLAVGACAPDRDSGSSREAGVVPEAAVEAAAAPVAAVEPPRSSEVANGARGAARVVAGPDSCSVGSEVRGVIGEDSWKIRREGDRTYVWAGGERRGPGSHWYDFTDALIPAGELQFGIGKDRIRAIDQPLFVAPDDPRLLDIPPSGYRKCERPRTNDEIMVIGYVWQGQPRAYPTALLDRHEVVNDQGSGKPFTVGW